MGDEGNTIIQCGSSDYNCNLLCNRCETKNGVTSWDNEIDSAYTCKYNVQENRWYLNVYDDDRSKCDTMTETSYIRLFLYIILLLVCAWMLYVSLRIFQMKLQKSEESKLHRAISFARLYLIHKKFLINALFIIFCCSSCVSALVILLHFIFVYFVRSNIQVVRSLFDTFLYVVFLFIRPSYFLLNLCFLSTFLRK